METLSNVALEQLEEKLNKEKILFWKDETHIYLQRKKIVFLYSDSNLEIVRILFIN